MKHLRWIIPVIGVGFGIAGTVAALWSHHTTLAISNAGAAMWAALYLWEILR